MPGGEWPSRLRSPCYLPALIAAAFDVTSSEARRLIEQGACG